jgi:hypothetical protein
MELKKMDIKKTVPILLILAMFGVFMGAIQPASAEPQIKLYIYDANNLPGTEIGTDITIKKGEKLIITSVTSDNGQPEAYQKIWIDIDNAQNKNIVKRIQDLDGKGMAFFEVPTNLDYGTYTIIFSHFNPSNPFVYTIRNVILHIT